MANPKVISLFSGAGGLDYGLEEAGFEIAVALEIDKDCCNTLAANRRRRRSKGQWEIIEEDIMSVSTERLLEAGALKPGEADLLVGGPPCQPFSKSGYWKRGDSLRLDDPRANTLSAYLRVLREAQPKAFLLENVEGLAYSGKDEGMRLLLDHLHKINRETGSNYSAHYQVLNAADYGVPQIRSRVFLVGSRDGKEFRFPKRTHCGDPSEGLKPHRTAWDALADVGPELGEDVAMRGKWRNLLPTIPEGENYLFHTERGGGHPLFGWRRRYWSFLLKLAKNRPSWTVQAQPGPAIGPFHWENRRLSMRELCRLQTFPDDVTIIGGMTSVQKQVGNAVASLVAEVLGREIRTQLLGLPRIGGRLKLLPQDRSPAPPPAEYLRVLPLEYRKYIGRHKAHPGTGKGYGARARQRLAG
jgi:DNA (cytosine-5)-methyltransferase 1